MGQYLALAQKYNIARMSVGAFTFEFFDHTQKKIKTLTETQGKIPVTGMPKEDDLLFWSSDPIGEQANA